MSYLGNMNGPRESEIVEKLGPQYFGITWEQLESDLSHYKITEMRREVVPLRLDEKSEPYILFSSPDKTGQRFYLLKEGYRLQGRMVCINNDGQQVIREFA